MGQATSKRTARSAQSIAGPAGVFQALKREGSTLHRTYRGKRGGGEVLFHIEPSGIPVKEKAARLAITSGRLLAQNDGLFAGTSQTWCLRPRETREQGLRRRSEEVHDTD
jgi:hypothetical protein